MRSTTKRRISDALKRYWASSPRKRTFRKPSTAESERPIRYFGQHKTIRLYSAPQKTIKGMGHTNPVSKGGKRFTLPVKKN